MWPLISWLYLPVLVEPIEEPKFQAHLSPSSKPRLSYQATITAPNEVADIEGCHCGWVVPSVFSFTAAPQVVPFARAAHLHHVGREVVRAPVEDGCDLRERFEILADLLLDVGSLDLHDDPLSFPQRGAVYLAERGGRERLLIEFEERLRNPNAEVFGDDPFDFGKRKRRDVVLKARERVDVGRREQVAAARQELAQLDERRAHRLQIGRQFLGLGGSVGLLRADIVVPSGLGDDIRVAVFDQQHRNVFVAADMREFQRRAHRLGPTEADS